MKKPPIHRPGNGQHGVTKHPRAQEPVHLLPQAVENSFELIAMTDVDGLITFANRAFLRTLGYSREEIIGKHIIFVFSQINDHALLLEIGEKCFMDEGWIGECLFARRDRTDVPLLLSVGPTKDGQGRVIGSFGVMQDISRQKMTEEALRQTEEQFRQLAENINEVFFITSPDLSRVIYLSPAYERIWGRPRQEMYDRPAIWGEALYPEDRERAVGVIAKQQEGLPTAMEFRIVRPDGSIRWISSHSFPVRDPHGRLWRVVGIAEDITARMDEGKKLLQAYEKLDIALQESEQNTRDADKLTELVDVLQSCQTVEEAYQIAASTLPTVLPSHSGALCITSSSRNIVEAVATWGDTLATEKTFAPASCWALRRGKAHIVNGSASPLQCAHVTASSADSYLCIPLVAQGEMLGLLYVEHPTRFLSLSAGPSDDGTEALARRASAVARRISLVLTNLRLRETLRHQSVRDPLTGLFNRRFMEESLERELLRGDRNGQPVALIMLDIDHFKQFNDTFGHQAGDAVLRELGDFLSQRTRGQDIACRFGGEEFVLILAGASVDVARKRAELLREGLKELTALHAGQTLGKITVSAGVSAFPDHGATAEDLIHAADQALYRAKAEGRDRVIVS